MQKKNGLIINTERMIYIMFDYDVLNAGLYCESVEQDDAEFCYEAVREAFFDEISDMEYLEESGDSKGKIKTILKENKKKIAVIAACIVAITAIIVILRKKGSKTSVEKAEQAKEVLVEAKEKAVEATKKAEQASKAATTDAEYAKAEKIAEQASKVCEATAKKAEDKKAEVKKLLPAVVRPSAEEMGKEAKQKEDRKKRDDRRTKKIKDMSVYYDKKDDDRSNRFTREVEKYRDLKRQEEVALAKKYGISNFTKIDGKEYFEDDDYEQACDEGKITREQSAKLAKELEVIAKKYRRLTGRARRKRMPDSFTNDVDDERTANRYLASHRR